MDDCTLFIMRGTLIICCIIAENSLLLHRKDTCVPITNEEKTYTNAKKHNFIGGFF